MCKPAGKTPVKRQRRLPAAGNGLLDYATSIQTWGCLITFLTVALLTRRVEASASHGGHDLPKDTNPQGKATRSSNSTFGPKLNIFAIRLRLRLVTHQRLGETRKAAGQEAGLDDVAPLPGLEDVAPPPVFRLSSMRDH